MKKIQLYLLTLLAVILSNICFTSCHDIKETDEADDLIGTWVWLDDEGYSTNRTYYSETLIFNKDKTYKLLWVEDTGIFDHGVFTGEESGTWSYDSKAHTLTLTTIIGEKPGTYTYDIILQGDQMTLIFDDYGYKNISGPYIKQ